MRTIITRLLTTLALSATVVTAGAIPAQSAQPPAPEIPVLTGIRTATHPTFDRIVLDFSGPRPQVSFRFVDELVRDGSGETEELPGAAFAEVRMTPAQAHDDAGNSSYPGPRKFRTANLNNVTAIAITGDYEAYLSVGVGMRKQTWVKAFTLDAPTRVVIDVDR
ncbi:MAG: AMIN-like domain-containing (lipo)protein [Pseudonocardiaceae bacterium]